jgi:tRNA pseudouridine55 synthase
MRRLLGERRIGHTGTLDPDASGVLPLVIGRATRLARFLSSSDKTYEATIRLGFSTDSYDASGKAVGDVWTGPWPSHEVVASALDAFRGEFVQQPPAFSAKKVQGRRSYKIARAAGSGRSHDGDRMGSGRVPHPVPVRVDRLDLVAAQGDTVMLRIDCSAGFYVRSLAHDLGQRLGTGAHLTALRRTRSGDLALADAIDVLAAERDPRATRAQVRPMESMLPGLSAAVLTSQGARHAAQGRDLSRTDFESPSAATDGLVRLLDQTGHLVGIAEPAKGPGILHPMVILV